LSTIVDGLGSRSDLPIEWSQNLRAAALFGFESSLSFSLFFKSDKVDLFCFLIVICFDAWWTLENGVFVAVVRNKRIGVQTFKTHAVLVYLFNQLFQIFALDLFVES
jgi:hypothetical protein